MTPNTKRIIAGIILTVGPILGVYKVKQTGWGSLLATPTARQKGETGAPVLITEYSDFQCPMCARIQPTLEHFLETYKGKVRLAYKYFPLSRIHKNALPAARAAECAAGQKKFWPYHDRLYQTQAEWAGLSDASPFFQNLAQEIQLDMARFNVCYADPATEAIVMRDYEEGQARQVGSTPTVFVDDERLVGHFIQSDGARMIERALRNQ